MTGCIEIIKRHARTKKIVERRSVQNLVVDIGKTIVCKLLAGDIGAEGARNYVKFMQFGTGTMPESESDDKLQLPITPVKTVTAAYPNSEGDQDWYVRFYASLTANQGNGFTISEAGLLTEGLVLIARKTFAGVMKTSDYIIEFRWTLRC
jgi:hypothetical protein